MGFFKKMGEKLDVLGDVVSEKASEVVSDAPRLLIP